MGLPDRSGLRADSGGSRIGAVSGAEYVGSLTGAECVGSWIGADAWAPTGAECVDHWNQWRPYNLTLLQLEQTTGLSVQRGTGHTQTDTNGPDKIIQLSGPSLYISPTHTHTHTHTHTPHTHTHTQT